MYTHSYTYVGDKWRLKRQVQNLFFILKSCTEFLRKYKILSCIYKTSWIRNPYRITITSTVWNHQYSILNCRYVRVIKARFSARKSPFVVPFERQLKSFLSRNNNKELIPWTKILQNVWRLNSMRIVVSEANETKGQGKLSPETPVTIPPYIRIHVKTHGLTRSYVSLLNKWQQVAERASIFHLEHVTKIMCSTSWQLLKSMGDGVSSRSLIDN